MRRRELILGLAAALAAAPPTLAEQPTIPVVAWLGFENNSARDGLRQGLRDLGYVEGQNITILYLFPDRGDISFAGPIAKLAQRKVGVIATAGYEPTAAMHQAALPIRAVFVVADPVGAGFVASLAHPGGNMTGLSLSVEEQFSGKWLELLKEVAPQLTRAAYLWNPKNHSSASSWHTMRALAPGLGMRIQSVELRDPKNLDEALAGIARDRDEGIIIDSDAVTGLVQSQVAAFARTNRIPLVSAFRRVVDAGGLISYGPNLLALWRHAAVCVDKILKGARPADLPVEQPTQFELVINLKTAQAIGFAIPQSLLARADEVIE